MRMAVKERRACVGVNCAEAIRGVAELAVETDQFVKRVETLVVGGKSGSDIIELRSGRVLQRDFIPTRKDGELFSWIKAL